MEKFETFTGIVAPLDRPNIDTDAIIPKQYLKSIKRHGFGINLFDDWRYLDHGNPGDDHKQRRLNPDFILNDDRYKDAQILLVRENFGCGSSREHAVWALLDYGFRVVIAPSYADIFYSNAFKNGLLPITLPSEQIDILFNEVKTNEGFQVTVNLEINEISDDSNRRYTFKVDQGLKNRILNGLDDIDVTLTLSEDIKAYEQKQKMEAPWLFQTLK